MRWLNSLTESVVVNLRNSGRSWRIEEPGVLLSIGWQRVGRDFAYEQQQHPIIQCNSYHFNPVFINNETEA